MLFDTDVLIRVLHKSTKTAKEIDKDDNRFISAVNDAEGTEQAKADVLVFATACKNSLTLCNANQIFFRNIASPDAKAIVPENSDALRLVLSSPLNGSPNGERRTKRARLPSTHYPLTCNPFSGKFFSPFTIAKRIFTLEEDITVLKNKCHSKSFQW